MVDREFGARNVLVAEGESLLRRGVAEALRSLGLYVYEAGHGDEAVEVISIVKIHALVLDSDLPDFGGLETIKVIRMFQRVPPFLLMADDPTTELRAAALETDATSVLPKPVDMSLLSDIVRSMLLRSAF